MRVPLFWQVLPVHLLILSFFLLPAWQHHAAVANALEAEKLAQRNLSIMKAAKNSKVEGQPNRILIPRLGIDLKIIDGEYSFTSSSWSVSNDTANYAKNTKVPNNKKDKTLIYGHWTPGVFGPTKDLKAGDTAYVYTSNNHILVYRYEYIEVVKPTDTHVFNEFKGRPGLVLMTCQGSWAQDRRLMFFNLQGVS